MSLKSIALNFLLGQVKHQATYQSAIETLKGVSQSVELSIDAANVVVAEASKRLSDLRSLNQKVNEVLKNA